MRTTSDDGEIAGDVRRTDEVTPVERPSALDSTDSEYRRDVGCPLDVDAPLTDDR